MLGFAKSLLLLIAFLIVMISFVAGCFVYYMGNHFDDKKDAIWWAFLRLSDSGYLGDDKGFLLTSVSTLITITGNVLFLGALIAILTQWFDQKMSQLESGITPISYKGHFVILGWNNKTPIIIRELFISEGRVDRFLKRLGTKGLKIAILTEEKSSEILQELQDYAGKVWRPSQLVVRCGNQLKFEHLNRAAFINSAVILLPCDQVEVENVSSVDGNTIKTLMTMSEVAKKRAKDLPLVVAEILDERKSTIAKKAYKGPIEIVLSNTYLSRLITQNLRNNGLSEVNAELLGHEWGNEVYLRDTDDLIGFKVYQLFSIFTEAIPIGIVRTLEGKIEPLLVPDFNETIREHDRIILIAEDFDKTKSTKTVSIENKIFNSKEFNLKEKKLRKILILGWNHRIPSILKEFDKYNKENTTLTIVSRTSVERREELVTMMGIELTTINICHIVSDFTSPSELKACQPSENDAILLVASDLTESDASTDARTILGYLLLLELFHNVKSKPHILIELLDIENKKLLKDKNCEIVVTPVVISHLLTHVSLRRELNVVFEELFGPDGAEINFIPLKKIDHVNEAINFEEIQQQCIEAGVICIGFRKFHDDKYHTILNPEKNKKFNFIEKDRLIIIAN